MVLAGVAHLHCLKFLQQQFSKLFLDALVHIETLGVVADLSVVANAAVYHPLCRSLQIGIGEHDGRSLSAQLQRHLGDVLRSGFHNLLTCTHAACHAHNVYLLAAGHLVSNHRALAGDDIDDACGQSHLVDHLGKLGTVLRSELRRLDHDGTAGYQRSTGLACDEEEREVPGQDACHHTDGSLVEHDNLSRAVAGYNLALDMACEGGHVVKIYRRNIHFHSGP